MNRFFDSVDTLKYMESTLNSNEKIELKFYRILGNISMMIVDHRINNNLSQEDLAILLGVSQPMIAKYESGEYNFSLKTLNALCAKIGVDFHVDLKPLYTTHIEAEAPCGGEYTATSTRSDIPQIMPFKYIDAA